MTISLSTTYADSQLNYTGTAHTSSVADLLGGGSLVLYSGTAPDGANESLNQHATNTALATFTFAGASSWTTTSTATLTLDIPTATVTASASGTATFFRILNSSGTALIQGSVAQTSGGDWNMTSTSVSSGDQVQISGTPTIALPVS